MKKIFFIAIIITLSLSLQAQKYAEYEKIHADAMEAYQNQDYFTAMRKFQMIKKSTTIKVPTQNNVSAMLDSCTNALENLTKTIQIKKTISDSLRNSVENAIFDIAATKSNSKDYFGSWNYLQIDTLDLSYSNLVYLPEAVQKCTKLKSINLIGNSNLNIDSAFIVIMNLPLATDIKVSIDSIKQIPNEYINWITGIKLNVDSLTKFPVEILNFPNLRYLDVSGRLPDSNYFSNLPAELFLKTKLEYLSLENCNLTELSEDISALKNLSVLKLSGNKLTAMPEGLSDLQNLRVLGIENNNFEQLPTSVCKLENLRVLSCYNNELTNLPPEIKTLKNLECLYLWNNNIDEIPDEICYLENLRDLRMYKNQINDINVRIACLKELQYLDLSNNKISQMPTQMGDLQNLKYLYLADNQITTFTLQLTQLKQLKTLNLSNNKIEELPPQISNLTNLQKLDIDSNQITSLPDEIVSLQNLTELNIQNNNITALPDNIGTMKNLQYINIVGNSLPETEMQKLTQSKNIVITQYLQVTTDTQIVQSQSQPIFSDNEPKMVFIEGGIFRMGSDNGKNDEKPTNNATISDFYIGKYEITFAEYDKFCDTTGRRKPSDNGWGRGNRPVINVNWNDAVAYCQWLSKQTGKLYRLPTEAEWEYVAGGGSVHQKWAGVDKKLFLSKYVWNDSNSDGKTHSVGEKLPNLFGIYDMSGNVREWCSDWYGTYSFYSKTNPQGASSGLNKVNRGGSWNFNADGCKVVSRGDNYPTYKNINLGFRVVCVF